MKLPRRHSFDNLNIFQEYYPELDVKITALKDFLTSKNHIVHFLIYQNDKSYAKITGDFEAYNNPESWRPYLNADSISIECDCFEDWTKLWHTVHGIFEELNSRFIKEAENHLLNNPANTEKFVKGLANKQISVDWHLRLNTENNTTTTLARYNDVLERISRGQRYIDIHNELGISMGMIPKIKQDQSL